MSPTVQAGPKSKTKSPQTSRITHNFLKKDDVQVGEKLSTHIVGHISMRLRWPLVIGSQLYMQINFSASKVQPHCVFLFTCRWWQSPRPCQPDPTRKKKSSRRTQRANQTTYKLRCDRTVGNSEGCSTVLSETPICRERHTFSAEASTNYTGKKQHYPSVIVLSRCKLTYNVPAKLISFFTKQQAVNLGKWAIVVVFNKLSLS